MKKLIIHIDDLGIIPAANEAGMTLFSKGSVTSGSIIVPANYSEDIIKYCISDSDTDIGVHLSVTCEWDIEKWSFLSIPQKIMPKTTKEAVSSYTLSEIENEYKKQIEYVNGLNISHIDNHMWASTASCQHFLSYLNLAKANGYMAHIPDWAMFSPEMISTADLFSFPKTKTIRFGNGGLEEMKKGLYSSLSSMKDGIGILTTHAVTSSRAAEKMIDTYQERLNEFKILADIDFQNRLKELGITLTNFKLINI